MKFDRKFGLTAHLKSWKLVKNFIKAERTKAKEEERERIRQAIPLFRAGELESDETQEFRNGRNQGLTEVRDILSANQDKNI